MNDDLSYFENIDSAINCFNTATNEQLLAFLENEDEVKKQIALLNITSINSNDNAQKIVFTLTNHSSETREYASFLINRLMKDCKFRFFFTGDIVLKKFEKSIFDVNPKVCRKILEILPVYIDLDKLFPLMINNAFQLLEELKEKNKEKNYQYNTKSFHLYWHVFALGISLNKEFYFKYSDKLNLLMQQLSTFSEYTLREKAAFLLGKILLFDNSKKLNEYIYQFKNDNNFYVKESL